MHCTFDICEQKNLYTSGNVPLCLLAVNGLHSVKRDDGVLLLMYVLFSFIIPRNSKPICWYRIVTLSLLHTINISRKDLLHYR